MLHPDDGEFYKIVAEAEALVAEGNSTIFQKFTCEICLARQTMDRPNALYKTGKCDECGHISNLERNGCGFMLVASKDPVAHRAFVNDLSRSIAKSQPRNRN